MRSLKVPTTRSNDWRRLSARGLKRIRCNLAMPASASAAVIAET